MSKHDPRNDHPDKNDMNALETFLEAERLYNDLLNAAHRFPTQKGIDTWSRILAADTARAEAARVFVAEAYVRHHIEERSVVYLVLTAQGWALDSPTFDGNPLEGYESGPLNTECEHPEDLNAECSALKRAATHIPLPAAVELADLLNSAARNDQEDYGTLKRALFHIDAQDHTQVFPGWHYPGVRWNGWACPRFDRATTERIIAWTAGSPENQQFTFKGDLLVPDDPEYLPVEPDVEGRYPIGAWAWVWEELDVPLQASPELIDAYLTWTTEAGAIYIDAYDVSSRQAQDQSVALAESYEASEEAGRLAVVEWRKTHPDPRD